MNRKTRAAPAHRQRGVAMLFIVLMLGVAVGTSTLLIWHAVRSTQEQQLTIHASTPAQASAWRGVEVLRRWLDAVDESALDGWADAGGVVPVAFGGAGDPGFSAGLTSVRKVGSAWRVEAAVTGLAAEGGAAQSRATVEVVYEVEPGEAGGGGGGGGTPVSGVVSAINIHRDLTLGGSINVTGAENAVFNVDGDAKLTGTVTGIETLRATGDISVGSNISVRNIHSNGDVTLNGGASGAQVRARGDVDVSGGVRLLAVQANGRVTFNGNSADLLESKTGVVVERGGVLISTVRSEGPVEWTGTGGGATQVHANGPVGYAGDNRPTRVRSRGNVVVKKGAADVLAEGKVDHVAGSSGALAARGDVTIRAGWVETVRTLGNTRIEGGDGVGRIDGAGNLHVAGWGSATGTIGGVLSRTERWNDKVAVRQVSGHAPDVPPVQQVVVDEVPEVVMPSARIDAWPLREVANYVFEIEQGKPRVTVANVQGIPDGSYVLGIRYANWNRFPDHLCRKADLQDDGICSRPVANICRGHSPQNACFTWKGGKWKVSGTSMARGIVWFNGDVELGNGTYVNTFIATGSITTAGGHRTLSPNYAGVSLTCENAQLPETWSGAYADFADLVPTNLCQVDTGTMVATALGNIAYLAGGTAPGSGGFSGGDITLGASTRADGSVLAGNVLTTGGDTKISGAIVSAAQGGGSDVSMGGSTTLDLSGGSEDYDPGTLPCGIVECAEEPGTEAGARRTRVLWTRYR